MILVSNPRGSKEVAKKSQMFVGRAFRHDIISLISSGVSTPEGFASHFSAFCESGPICIPYGVDVSYKFRV